MEEKSKMGNDRKFYTSLGVSTGIDMILGFINDLYGIETASKIAKHTEYIWNKDKDNDLFCNIV